MLRSLILTGAVNGLFFIVLLRAKVKNTNSDRLLMVWMGIIALQQAFYYDNLSAQPIFPQYIQLLSFSLPLINSSLFYFYIRSLSFGPAFKLKGISLHLVPFLVFNCIIFSLYFINPGSLKFIDAFPYFSSNVNLWIVYGATSLLAIVPAYYSAAGLIILIRHQKMLADNYSYTEKINLDWLRWIVISMNVLFIGLFLLIKYGTKNGLVNDSNLFAVVGTVITVYIFFIGFCGARQNAIPDATQAVTTDIKKVIASTGYKNSGLNDQKAEQLFIKLTKLMDETKPFLQDDLSLRILAGQLGVTVNQLSQAINQKSGSNFFNFINGYRVQLVKEKLKDPSLSHYSILGIAYECGFRSKSSFNKIFKATTGQTPQQYQKSIG